MTHGGLPDDCEGVTLEVLRKSLSRLWVLCLLSAAPEKGLSAFPAMNLRPLLPCRLDAVQQVLDRDAELARERVEDAGAGAFH